MNYTTILGLIAGALTTASFLPQLIKIWKSKSSKDISLGMFIVFCFGVSLWFVYGILINALPVIIFNVITFILALAILTLAIKYRRA
ncbi:MAG: SemiSWEET transporter [bacterium]|nr:SemiSWEET transporter [bacterium]